MRIATDQTTDALLLASGAEDVSVLQFVVMRRRGRYWPEKRPVVGHIFRGAGAASDPIFARLCPDAHCA